jgi:5,10-methenyltetrahydromethanopterin hydrogenase
MIETRTVGNHENVVAIKFGSGDIMMHHIEFEKQDEKFAVAFCQTAPHKIGEETSEYLGKTTDELPDPVKAVMIFTKPESITALIHTLIECQKRMFDNASVVAPQEFLPG